jgi:hypothetical protein
MSDFTPQYMTITEAEEVLRMVREELYPPTNPIVLLRAALTLRWEHRRSQEALEVLRWLFTIEHTEVPA